MDLATARLLTSPEGLALLASLGPYDERTALATSTRLRADGHAPELAAAVMAQSALRSRGRAKLGDRAADLLLTPDGLEQATRPAVARHHAARLAASGADRVLDLGCGLGLDALAHAEAGLAVEAVDADEATAELARHNLARAVLPPRTPAPVVRHGLAEDAPPAGPCTAVWLDPARRTPGIADVTGRTRRTWRLDDLAPSWELVQRLGREAPAAGAKLSPAFPHAARPDGVEAQWVSWQGEVLECVLWWGGAVRHPGRTALALSGDPADPTSHLITEADLSHESPELTGDLGEWLYEPDRAVIRAGLVGVLEAEVDGGELAPGAGYVRSGQERVVPWARRFRVLAEIPLQDKAIRAYLRERGCGVVTLKKRGVEVDPDRLRRSLRLKGTGDHAVLVLTRQGGRPVALHVAPA